MRVYFCFFLAMNYIHLFGKRLFIIYLSTNRNRNVIIWDRESWWVPDTIWQFTNLLCNWNCNDICQLIVLKKKCAIDLSIWSITYRIISAATYILPFTCTEIVFMHKKMLCRTLATHQLSPGKMSSFNVHFSFFFWKNVLRFSHM